MPASVLSAIRWDLNPIIFNLKLGSFELPITWYGVLFASGFLIGQKIIIHIFRTDGKPPKDVDSLTIYAIVGAVAGARIGHYLFYEWEFLFDTPLDWLISMITPPFAGLASHGAMIGMPIALYLYSRHRPDQPFLWVVDRVAIPVCLAGALIRLGNIINSEIYGTPTSLPWGFLFVRETDPSLLPVVPRHPTGIYEALFCLFMMWLTYHLWKTKRETAGNGFITGVFFILLFSFRFLVEFIKNNQAGFEDDLTINMGQWLSVPGILVGVAAIVYSKRKQPRANEVAGTEA
jgi:phosphatidylglycerol---prolipoprotein diacylglyceryl transferase